MLPNYPFCVSDVPGFNVDCVLPLPSVSSFPETSNVIAGVVHSIGNILSSSYNMFSRLKCSASKSYQYSGL